MNLIKDHRQNELTHLSSATFPFLATYTLSIRNKFPSLPQNNIVPLVEEKKGNNILIRGGVGRGRGLMTSMPTILLLILKVCTCTFFPSKFPVIQLNIGDQHMFPWCLIIACSIFYFRYLSSQVHLELAYLYLYYYEFKRARVIKVVVVDTC